MYTQTFLVTSVVGRVFAPQIAANASLSFFGAKRPTPFFFWANAIFFPLAFAAVLPNVRFCAVIFFSVAFVIVVFVVVLVVGGGDELCLLLLDLGGGPAQLVL